MKYLTDNELFNVFLLCTIIGEFLLPCLLERYYTEYNGLVGRGGIYAARCSCTGKSIYRVNGTERSRPFPTNLPIMGVFPYNCLSSGYSQGGVLTPPYCFAANATSPTNCAKIPTHHNIHTAQKFRPKFVKKFKKPVDKVRQPVVIQSSCPARDRR